MIKRETLMLQAFNLDAEPPAPRGAPKCGVCGRFTKRSWLVWSGGPEPEPDYYVGECCYDKVKYLTRQ